MRSLLRRFRGTSPTDTATPGLPQESEVDLLERAFMDVLGRHPDPAGRAHYLHQLRAGLTRDELVTILRESDEYRNKVESEMVRLPDLCAISPDRYMVLSADDGVGIPVYIAESPEAFDAIESAIIENGYYEKPGIWSLRIDLDKRVMAEVLSFLEPRSAIEVGCSSGAVLQCLDELGVEGYGVEISRLARDHATPTVRDRIFLGDLVELSLRRTFDIGFGLDVFEHINPNKLDAFISTLVSLVSGGGFVVANVPSFGEDPIFGEVFPMFLPEWRDDASKGRLFRHLQVDAQGYPMHGHLIWATSAWWVNRFERAGLRRERDIEDALHSLYDWYFDLCCPARKSLYVFSKHGDEGAHSALAKRIASRESEALTDLRLQLAEAEPGPSHAPSPPSESTTRSPVSSSMSTIGPLVRPSAISRRGAASSVHPTIAVRPTTDAPIAPNLLARSCRITGSYARLRLAAPTLHQAGGH